MDIEKENRENFWVNKLVREQTFNVSEEGLEKLEGPLLLLILVALIAGFVSFISPCTLPIIPAYFAYMFNSTKKNLRGMTIAFFLGLSIIFTSLGMLASFIGNIIKTYLTLFSQIAGILILLFGIYILFGKGFAGMKVKQSQPKSYLGAFFFGTVFATSWTPCVGPILVSLLLLASTTSSFISGGLLLFIYAIGLALPLILISTYMGKINKESKLWKFIEGREIIIRIEEKIIRLHTNSLISGILFIILGYLIFSGILFAFNQYITATSFQKFIFGLEDKLLGLLR